MNARTRAACWRLGASLALLLTTLVLPAAAQEAESGSPPEEEEPGPESVNAPPPAVPPESVPPGTDSVTASPGATYAGGALHRFLFGDLNRNLWEIPITVEVLDLGSEGGGLTPSELSGGQQTVGLHFDGADGLPYQFRSIVKDATRALPGPLRISPLTDVVQDQMAGQFPLGAMVVAELLETAGVLVAKPRPVVMPDDPRLGEYRELFAGRMGWIEERPDEREGDRPGFRGSSKVTGTEEMYERLDEDPRNYVHQERLLTARLIDMLVGDWDRHHDQWRWASFEDDGRIRWEPVPRDRDWAFSRLDGLFPGWASWYYPQYHGFDREPDVFRLHWNAQFLDRRLLTELPRERYEATADRLVRLFSDEALRSAIGALPASYRDAVGEELFLALQARRDALPRLAREFYALLARWVDVHTSNADDVSTLTIRDDGAVDLEVRVPDAGDLLYYHRVFVADETDEIRLYSHGGADAFRVIGGTSPIKLRLAGGQGDDRYVDETSGENVLVYDDDDDNEYELGADAFLDETEFDTLDELPDIDLIWETRDWGSNWVPMPYASYDPDVGPYLGASVTRYGFGFRRDPWRSKLTLAAAVGPALGRTLGLVSWTRTLTTGGLRGGLEVEWRTVAAEQFFGFGNETADLGSDFHTSERSSLDLGLRLESAQDQPLTVFAGPVVGIAGAVDAEEGSIFEEARPYGAGTFHQAGLRGGVALSKMDEANLPGTGGEIELTGRFFPVLLDVEEPFGSARIVARGVLAAPEDAPLAPAIHVRTGGLKVWGNAPFHELAALGGERSLPGYSARRFLGQEALSGAILLRLKLARLDWPANLDLGVLGLSTTGRVWLEGEDSDTWHTGHGGGIWIRPASMRTAFSLSVIDGEDRTRLYLRMGFPF